MAPVLASGPRGGNNMVYPAIGLAYLFLLLDEALLRGGITREVPPRFSPSFVCFFFLPAVVSCPWLLSACASVMLLGEKGTAELSWHQRGRPGSRWCQVLAALCMPESGVTPACGVRA